MFPSPALIPALILLLTCYLAGSIPSTLIASRMSANVDLRKFGSGNAGGTNAIRVLGPVRGVIAGASDVVKGYACTALIAPLWFQQPAALEMWQVAAGAASIVGHIWPVWASFRGGKGVATCIGVLAALDLPVAATFCVIGLIAAIGSRYVSVGSLTASLLLPLVLGIEAVVFQREVAVPVLTLGLLLPLLIVYTHRSNIRRLTAGTELRLGHRVDLSGLSGSSTDPNAAPPETV